MTEALSEAELEKAVHALLYIANASPEARLEWHDGIVAGIRALLAENSLLKEGHGNYRSQLEFETKQRVQAEDRVAELEKALRALVVAASRLQDRAWRSPGWTTSEAFDVALLEAKRALTPKDDE